jgi:hypothetical protein
MMITLLNLNDVDLIIKNLDAAELDGYQRMSPTNFGTLLALYVFVGCS